VRRFRSPQSWLVDIKALDEPQILQHLFDMAVRSTLEI